MKVATIVGARPQFIKAAVVSRAIAAHNEGAGSRAIDETLIHTGQHFDDNMSRIFFDELELPRPAHHLGVAGGPHGEMTARMMLALDPLLADLRPDFVLVYGDTNSTLAGALAAAAREVPLAHVEAGLRSFNRAMPEERNRIVTDHIAALLFAPTDAAVRNLRSEGIEAEKIRRVGDVMYDAMRFHGEKAAATSDIARRLDLEPKAYVLATLHRAENVDDAARLRSLLTGLSQLAERWPVVLPLHPRTRRALDVHDLAPPADGPLRLIEPVGYLDMIALQRGAVLIATDSGGVQKEAYFNRVPCLTLREETEWVELVEVGANALVGADPQRLLDAAARAVSTPLSCAELYGDGHAGAHIVEILAGEGSG